MSSASTPDQSVERGCPVAALVVRPSLRQVVDHAHRGYLRFGRYSRGRAGDGARLRPPGAHVVRPAGGARRARRSGGRRTPRRGRRRRTASSEKAYWNDRPQKKRPGASSQTPRYSRRPAVLAEGPAGRSSRRPGGSRSPRPRWRRRRPCRRRAREPVPHALDAGLVADDSALCEVGALHAQHRPAVEAEVAHLLASDRRTPRDHVTPHEHDDRTDDRHPSRLEPDRDLPAVTPDERGRPGRGRLVGDVACRSARRRPPGRGRRGAGRVGGTRWSAAAGSTGRGPSRSRARTASARRCRSRPRRCRRRAGRSIGRRRRSRPPGRSGRGAKRERRAGPGGRSGCA